MPWRFSCIGLSESLVRSCAESILKSLRHVALGMRSKTSNRIASRVQDHETLFPFLDLPVLDASTFSYFKAKSDPPLFVYER